MQCISCKENHIKNSNNCYLEVDSTIKTFYASGSTTEITSCFQSFNKYIIENTYECIDSIPNIGYYLSNIETGLLSPCHTDCKTCSNINDATSTKCNSCNNEDYYLLDGNCIISCPQGYYSTISNDIKICKKCYQNCMSCNTGEVYNDELKLINMNCLECKKEEDPNDPNIFIDNQIKIDLNCFPIKTYTEEKIIFDVSELDIEVTEKTCLDYGKAIIYGEYQCITKELNYYYVLNNDENTGVIDICDMSCESCNGKKNTETQDTNCINCIEGYYKTDDSNTNCILENLIPENYFKNDLDNIYYKCYFSCSKCSQLELDEFNHNCDILIIVIII